ncbi:hypothetical protein [Andreprevotia chitinilytica]|uniref:hypothetical protein n=1 Tax=Andreprevotia chitinilytica TaxID=396808 RepID=UPI0012EB3603|nr:hypothetical protein [Andreprevotia chitinilytica]
MPKGPAQVKPGSATDVHPVVEEAGHPFGFTSEDRYRALTRPLAQANRDKVVFTRGSSVTGYGFNSGQRFGEHSDYDIGVANPKRKGAPGFARTKEEVAENQQIEQAFRAAGNKKASVKYFTYVPQGALVRRHSTELSPASGAAAGGGAAAAAGAGAGKKGGGSNG